MKRSMKNTLTSSMLVATMLAGTISSVSAGPARLNVPLTRLPITEMSRSNLRINPNVIRRPVIDPRASCTDLAVFVRQRRVNDRWYVVTFGVRNVSTNDYVSRDGQQTIDLAKNGAALANESFSVLNAGQTLTWSQPVPRPSGVTDTYDARYSFDPDIYDDGNPRNDDCNSANNVRSVEIR